MFREFLADWIYPEGRERRDSAERAADTDALTGLGNRRALDRALPAAEADPRTTIVLFDADNFGEVNKLAGHGAGDELLREMAAALRLAAKRFGCGGRVFRAGGDEFVVLAPARWARRLRDTAEKEFGRHSVGSVGEISIAISGTTGQTLADADRALQSRKRQRKLNKSSFQKGEVARWSQNRNHAKPGSSGGEVLIASQSILEERRPSGLAGRREFQTAT